MAKKLAAETTNFWMSVVQDEKLQQLGMQLHEEEAQLKMMWASIKSIPPMVQISKATELKALQ